MRQNHEHPLYHLDAETLLVATYIWVDDELKTLGVSKRLCTGGIPLLKHLLQRLPRLREPLEPPLRPPPCKMFASRSSLPLRLQVQELVHRLLAGKLVGKIGLRPDPSPSSPAESPE